MLYTPANFPREVDSVIYPAAANAVGPAMSNMAALGAPASAAWPTAAKAIYIPFALDRPVTIFRVGWHNGAAAQAGTREVGCYTSAGVKLISGSATAVTVSVCQFVDVTDTVIGPGQYYLAMMDTGTATLFAWAPTAPLMAGMGIYTQTAANPLPSPATFAIDNTIAYIPLCFLQCRSVM